MENNNNNLQTEDQRTIPNGHAQQNGNGTVGVATAAPAEISWRQYLWNSWDAFADVMWFIICSIGFILQVRNEKEEKDLYEVMSLELLLPNVKFCVFLWFIYCCYFSLVFFLFYCFITAKTLESFVLCLFIYKFKMFALCLILSSLFN